MGLEMANCLVERTIGNTHVLVAVTEKHASARLEGPTGQLRRHGRLATPGSFETSTTRRPCMATTAFNTSVKRGPTQPHGLRSQ